MNTVKNGELKTANALERIASAMERQADASERSTNFLEVIAAALSSGRGLSLPAVLETTLQDSSQSKNTIMQTQSESGDSGLNLDSHPIDFQMPDFTIGAISNFGKATRT